MYEVYSFLLLPAQDLVNVLSKLLLKRFVAQDFFSGIFNNQLLQNSFKLVKFLSLGMNFHLNA